MRSYSHIEILEVARLVLSKETLNVAHLSGEQLICFGESRTAAPTTQVK